MFESKKDITNYCNANGYFIIIESHKRRLAKKTADDSYNALEDVTTKKGINLTAIEYFIRQLDNNLMNPTIVYPDIIECIPIINMDVFKKFDEREMEIGNYKTILDKLNDSKFKLFGKSNNLVSGQKYVINNRTGKYDYVNAYFNIIDNELVYIDERQLSDKDKQKALEFKNLEIVENALKDNLENQHTENYNAELRKWQLLK